MIKIRLDVDYPYPSRNKSLLFAALNLKAGKDYLENSKILAKMFNESPEMLRAYWFFTPQTIPDGELLTLLNPDKHEVALHVATDPYAEWKQLEKVTKRKVKYYTVHGTARLLARLMWRRKIWEARAPIPADFPLKSFYDFPTIGLDCACYSHPPKEALKIARESITKELVLHVHPEWLFQRGTLNHRGPYYEVLRAILQVDKDMDGLDVQKQGIIRIAKRPEQFEYLNDFIPTDEFFEKLAKSGVDVYTFVERKWCCTPVSPSNRWHKTEDNIAILKINSYEEWWNSISKKTRNMIRKAEKSSIKTQVILPSDTLAEGIWKIYNETPIRQGRTFPHYGSHLEDVKRSIAASKSDIFIAATLEDQIIGFIQLTQGDKMVVMTQILSLQKYWDKAVNNALVAKAVEVCSERKEPWLMYGRIGNHPSLDAFKESNGFTKFELNRYYVPLTRKGQISVKLGLHRKAKDALPEWLKGPLIPVFNWLSRKRMQMRSNHKIA
jgi:hypothetical protein